MNFLYASTVLLFLKCTKYIPEFKDEIEILLSKTS
jgi:hypothetical protein